MEGITKEFLEEALTEPVSYFNVTSASKMEAGHSSLVFAIEVQLKRVPVEKRHLILKCYPNNPGKQDMLSRTNSFRREYMVYHAFIPELIRFQTNTRNIYSNPAIEHHIIKPPFTELVYGRTVDYSTVPKQGWARWTKPLDNFILMPDLRQQGFRFADPFKGLDLDHSKLVIEAQARTHALSWACKQLNNIDRLVERFPFMLGTFFDEMSDKMILNMLDRNLDLFRTAVDIDIQHDLVKKSIHKGLDEFLRKSLDICTLFFSDQREVSDPDVNKDNLLRIPQSSFDNEQPWLVATHGDCGLNNMMFRYDETGKPVEVIFIDLQFARENDPCVDLVYHLHTSTTSAIRGDHLDEFLKLYCLTFIRICERFKVVPLPGFQLSELKRRFHRAKTFGMVMAVIGLPLFLIEKDEINDMDENHATNTEGTMCQISRLTATMSNNPTFRRRAVELVRELWQEGVI